MKGTLALLLTSVFTTLAGKICSALGLSIITYVGSTALQQKLISGLQENLNAVPQPTIQLFYIAGGGVALNWILGGISFALAFKTMSKLGTVFASK